MFHHYVTSLLLFFYFCCLYSFFNDFLCALIFISNSMWLPKCSELTTVGLHHFDFYKTFKGAIKVSSYVG